MHLDFSNLIFIFLQHRFFLDYNILGSSLKFNLGAALMINKSLTLATRTFSSNVSTNVGGRFLKIIDKCFPPSNPLHKIINRNKVKMAYKKMPNMKEILGRHNMEVTRNGIVSQYPLGCNCRGGVGVCPLEGSCLTPGVVYEATVETLDGNLPETYTGLTAGRFKDRYNKHSSDFNNYKQKKSTELSKHIWRLKKRNDLVNHLQPVEEILTR